MKKFAFTLAEVLITLTIIGVIAALTIPNLMQKWQDHADVVKVKETYSILSNALKMAIAENGPINSWVVSGDNYQVGRQKGEIISRYLKVIKSGKLMNINSTIVPTKSYTYYTLNGDKISELNTNNSITLPSGVMIYFSLTYTANDAADTYIFFDINGEKLPNKLGYDIFEVGYSNTEPIGFKTSWNFTQPNYCSMINGSQAVNGISCCYWIMKHGNMDYKYRDVSKEW